MIGGGANSRARFRTRLSCASPCSGDLARFEPETMRVALLGELGKVRVVSGRRWCDSEGAMKGTNKNQEKSIYVRLWSPSVEESVANDGDNDELQIAINNLWKTRQEQMTS